MSSGSNLEDAIEALSQAYISALLTVAAEAQTSLDDLDNEPSAAAPVSHRSDPPTSNLHKALALLGTTTTPTDSATTATSVPLLTAPPFLRSGSVNSNVGGRSSRDYVPPSSGRCYKSPSNNYQLMSGRAHKTLKPATTTTSTSSPVSFQKIQCFKTKPCRFWLDGRCTRGDQCTFAHADGELRDKPDLTKTKICAKWRVNQCTKSAHECTYAHGVEELRHLSSPFQGGCSSTASTNGRGNTPTSNRGGDDHSPASSTTAGYFHMDSHHSIIDKLAASFAAIKTTE